MSEKKTLKIINESRKMLHFVNWVQKKSEVVFRVKFTYKNETSTYYSHIRFQKFYN